MRVTCVGTGTASPEGDRACSGYWVEAGDARLLLDCGPGVVHSLARLGIGWPGITHLVLTHFHNDHIGDVPFLFFALHYGARETRSAPIAVVGPDGTRQLFRRLARAFGRHLRSPAFDVQFTELRGGQTLEIAPNLRLAAQETPHTGQSLAYRLEDGTRAVGYTGDTGDSPSLGGFMRGVDVLIAECSLPEQQALDAHLTPGRLARLAAAASPRLLVATHVYPQLDRSALPDAIREAGWGGEVVVARDGLVLP
jgi:ribonuclease BN (tRNA processing enzyme)